MVFPSIALYGEFWDGQLKNMLPFMQAAVNEEEEEKKEKEEDEQEEEEEEEATK